jgi:hypothetical protein
VTPPLIALKLRLEEENCEGLAYVRIADGGLSADHVPPNAAFVRRDWLPHFIDALARHAERASESTRLRDADDDVHVTICGTPAKYTLIWSARRRGGLGASFDSAPSMSGSNGGGGGAAPAWEVSALTFEHAAASGLVEELRARFA